MKKLNPVIALLLLANVGFGQSTFQKVYTILQANCTGSCHTVSTPDNLILTGTQQQVYAALFNVNPVNSMALANGNKLIDAGDPWNSFLFNKINHGLDPNLSLQTGEGTAMPDSVNSLTQVEREIVRQWILFGAQETGTFDDDTAIVGYYVGQGGYPKQVPLAQPAPGTGVQLHWGPLFVKPGVEIQYDINSYLRNKGVIDVSEFKSQDNPESHHFAIWDFYPGHDTAFAKGMNLETTLGDFATLWDNAPLLAQYPKNMDMIFPQGTAMVWDSATVLSLSFHMINYTDSILAAEAWLNVYYSPHQQNTITVQAAPVIYDYPTPWLLTIPNDSVNHTFTIDQHDPDSAFIWNIISMQAHTHKTGVNYNVWQRNADGSKGNEVYVGDYSADYSYDQGVYIWNDPPFRKFDTILQVDMRNGLIHEATYNNSSDHVINFGLTTADEMFITFLMYYKTDFPSAIGEPIYVDENIKMYPNPVTDVAYVKIITPTDVKDAQLKIYDLLGNEVLSQEKIEERYFKVNMMGLASGSYVYRLFNNGSSLGTGKIIVQH